MYKEMETVLYERRTVDCENGVYHDIDSVVRLLIGVVSGDIFNKAGMYPDADWDTLHNYQEQLETHGIHTVKYILETPDVLYDEVAQHFDGDTLERNVFDEYYGELVKDAGIMVAAERILGVNRLMTQNGPIPDKMNAMVNGDYSDRLGSVVSKWLFLLSRGFGSVVVPEKEER